ncbi:zinc-ribbon domain-containing protein [Domibacillus epiphyticus]|uniref:Treble clef zinc finger domain-containing protein n=1 Tax=Domibacillus epiphyticus TaxID=1714355 RepID=A0A1V2ACG6_9BACI|nr:zinc-ribbon domain-containing protein [Domibacillus epiphyticus]OMP68693.1 hypothetical protein BTO28_01195 [Domibacillus epiphyticus]
MQNKKGFIIKERPDLVEEWHSIGNAGNTPDNVKAGSDKKILWCCKKCNYVWKSTAKNRALKNTGCPKCNERYNVGFPELAIYFYLKQVFKDAKLNHPIATIDKEKKVDIFIPSLSLIIEYDGGHTHRGRERIDKEKSYLLLESGYYLIRVRDNGLPSLKLKSLQEYFYERTTNRTVGKMITEVLEIINKNFKGFTEKIKALSARINIDIDTIPILAQIPAIIEKDNLLKKCPSITKIWDYERNYPLLPENFKPFSNLKVWFICDKKHPTLSQIGSKAAGHGCQVCAGQVATEEHNLEILFPKIAKEWNFEKNTDNFPYEYLPFSNKLVFWKCPRCQSSYDKKINERTAGNEGCPYCAGKRVNETNCLAFTHPDIAAEWDYNKNKGLVPELVTKGSHKKVWWICKKSHSYEAFIYSRTGGRGCPDCHKLDGRHLRKKIKKENSLAVKKPLIAKQWHPMKNDSVTPEEIGAFSRKEYWWQCEKGHEWKKAPNSRRSHKCEDCQKTNI